MNETIFFDNAKESVTKFFEQEFEKCDFVYSDTDCLYNGDSFGFLSFKKHGRN